MGPKRFFPGARIGDNVLIGLKITRCNFNQLEAAFRHPAKSFPRGLQITGQLASCFECPFLSILGASWLDFWKVLGFKLGSKLTKKSIIWRLVGKLAEIAKKKIYIYEKNHKFFNLVGPLGLPTSKQN